MNTYLFKEEQTCINSIGTDRKEAFDCSLVPHEANEKNEKDCCESEAPKISNEVVSLHCDLVGDFSEAEQNIEAEVESEANAESLSSSEDSEADEAKKACDITYFRFTRQGLSVFVNLDDYRWQPSDYGNEQNVEGRVKECLLVQSDVLHTKVNLDHSINNNNKGEEEAEKDEKKGGETKEEEKVDIADKNNDDEEDANDDETISELLPNENFEGCPIVSFEELCIQKYPASYPIGYNVDRFSRVDMASLNSTAAPLTNCLGLRNPNIVTETSNVADHTCATSSSLSNNLILSTAPSIVSKVSCSNELETTSSVNPNSSRATVPSFYREDRLSGVIQNILYRLNRQGTLANPQDVCRRGGGKSGDYYDLDDEFFDDSLTYEVLGISALESPHYESCGTVERGDSCLLDDLVYDSKLSDPYESPDDEYYNHLYNYKHSAMFQCDNVVENDHICILSENCEEMSEDSKDVQHISSHEDSSSETDSETVQSEGASMNLTTTTALDKSQKKKKVYMFTKYWIRRKAWREYEPKLTANLITVLSNLEASLKNKGKSNGLFVNPVDVAMLCRDVVRDAFSKEYPHVSWDSSSLVASMYPDTFASRETKDLNSTRKVEQETYHVQAIKETDTHYFMLHNTCNGESSSYHSGSLMHSKSGGVDVDQDQPAPLTHNPIESAKTACSSFPLPPPPPPPSPPSSVNATSSPIVDVTATMQNVVQDGIVEKQVSTSTTTATASSGKCSGAQHESTELSDSLLERCLPLSNFNSQETTNKPKKRFKKKSTAATPSFQNIVTTDDIVSLAITPTLKQLGICLMKMTNIVTPDLLKKWLTHRLVLYNQVVYSALEQRLYKYILHKSSLFRTRGSFFFRSLKKAVDAYLKSLASSNNGHARSTPHGRSGSGLTNSSKTGATPTFTPEIQPSCKTVKEKPPKLSENSAGATCTAENQTPNPLPDSPFAPVAKELLNWAIVYNCRKHELKVLGETLDEWAGSFYAYAVDILNQSIQKRLNTGPQASGTTNATQACMAAPKKNRLRIPTKFLEETLTQFKDYYGVTTLYERRGNKPTIPQFLTPCKGLHPPAFRVLKKNANTGSSKTNLIKTVSNTSKKKHSEYSTFVGTSASLQPQAILPKMKIEAQDSQDTGSKVGTLNETQRFLPKKRRRSDLESLKHLTKKIITPDKNKLREVPLCDTKKNKSEILNEKKSNNLNHVSPSPSSSGNESSNPLKVVVLGKVQSLDSYFTSNSVSPVSSERQQDKAHLLSSKSGLCQLTSEPQQPDKSSIPSDHVTLSSPTQSKGKKESSLGSHTVYQSYGEPDKTLNSANPGLPFSYPPTQTKSGINNHMREGRNAPDQSLNTSHNTSFANNNSGGSESPSCQTSRMANNGSRSSAFAKLNFPVQPISLPSYGYSKPFLINSSNPSLLPSCLPMNVSQYDCLPLVNPSFNNTALYNLSSSTVSPSLSFLSQYSLPYSQSCPSTFSSAVHSSNPITSHAFYQNNSLDLFLKPINKMYYPSLDTLYSSSNSHWEPNPTTPSGVHATTPSNSASLQQPKAQSEKF